MKSVISNKRNYGIDLLRIISMFYVVVLHCLGHGGILDNVCHGTLSFKIAWFMETWAYCAVDLFAIISGFVCYSEIEKKHKYSQYVTMWLQVVFYGVIGVLIAKLINPTWASKFDLRDMCFPVTNNLYWYFTAYTGLFFIIPLLNSAVRGCSDRLLKKSLLVIFVLFSVFDNYANQFNTNGGYSFIWLILLYLIGAIIKKCNLGSQLKIKFCLLGIVSLNLISWLWLNYGVEFWLVNKCVKPIFLISYTSPTILLSAILYVIGFSKMNFSNKVTNIIKFAAPGTFAVYILNNHRIVYKHLMEKRFIPTLSSIPFMVVIIILFSIAFVVVSILIDKARVLLFKSIRINKLVELFINLFKKIVYFLKEKSLALYTRKQTSP